jgi:hypothetical protein
MKGLPWLEQGLSKSLSAGVDLRILGSEDVPQEPGVYIMQSQGIDYTYPRHKSKVFYIGSGGLRQRLWGKHRRFCLEIWENRRDRDYHYYYPIYEYAASHGCMVSWLTCADIASAKVLEHDMLVSFATYYGAWPVANTKEAW